MSDGIRHNKQCFAVNGGNYTAKVHNVKKEQAGDKYTKKGTSLAFGNAVASDCAWRNKGDACLRFPHHNIRCVGVPMNRLVTFVDVAGDVVGCEEGEELRTSHFARIMTGGTEGAEDAGTAAVLLWGDPLQVVGTPVEHVAVNVIALIAFRTWTEPGESHEEVAGTIAVPSHERVTRVTHLGVLWRFETGFDFAQAEAREGEEMPATGTIERFAAGQIQRTTFGGKHSAVLRVDAHSRPALIGETVCIHTDGLVNHNSTRFRGYERWVNDTSRIGWVSSLSTRKRVQRYEK